MTGTEQQGSGQPPQCVFFEYLVRLRCCCHPERVAANLALGVLLPPLEPRINAFDDDTQSDEYPV